MMKKIATFLLKQYDLGIWPGAAKDLYTRVSGYAGMISFALIVPTAYHTTLKEPLQLYLPWMDFWIFASFSVILLLAIGIFDYKFILPSALAWRNYQEAKHHNVIRQDIKVLKKELSQIIRKEIADYFESRNRRGASETK